MAYVRKVRTASGAVAVQVARKDQGKVVILAHLGSAHTDAELGILLHAARQMVLDGQAALDFEVSARAQSMADVADFRDGGLICPPGRSAAPAPVAPPGRTLGTNSRLLYEVLAHLYGWLGFDEVGDEVFRDLVIARIVEPTSKVDALRVLGDLGAPLVSYKTIDRHVRGLHASAARDVVAANGSHLLAVGGELGQVDWPPAAAVVGVEQNLALDQTAGRLNNPQHRFDGHAFAAAALADNADDLAGLHVEAHAIDGFDLAFVKVEIGLEVADGE